MATNKNVTSNKLSPRKSKASKAVSQATLDPAAPSAQDERIRLIRERAYYKAQQRGFAAGHELQDWYEAEHELNLESTTNIVH